MEEHEHKWIEIPPENTGAEFMKKWRCECGAWKYQPMVYSDATTFPPTIIYPPIYDNTK